MGVLSWRSPQIGAVGTFAGFVRRVSPESRNPAHAPEDESGATTYLRHTPLTNGCTSAATGGEDLAHIFSIPRATNPRSRSVSSPRTRTVRAKSSSSSIPSRTMQPSRASKSWPPSHADAPAWVPDGASLVESREDVPHLERRSLGLPPSGAVPGCSRMPARYRVDHRVELRPEHDSRDFFDARPSRALDTVFARPESDFGVADPVLMISRQKWDVPKRSS